MLLIASPTTRKMGLVPTNGGRFGSREGFLLLFQVSAAKSLARV